MKASFIGKRMKHQGFEWSQDYQSAGMAALRQVLEERMSRSVYAYLEHEALHSIVERIFKKDGKPPSCPGALFHVLQFRPHP